MVWTAGDRRTLLDAYFDAVRQIQVLSTRLDVARGAQADALSYQIGELSDQLVNLADRYLSDLPSIALSRCPFTGIEMHHSFDALGLDGLWWQRDDPVRPEIEPDAGQYFVGLTGAVACRPPLEQTPCLVVPGPDVPFVIPRLLRAPDTKAVIRQIGVGGHVAYAIAYFSQARIALDARPTIWGTKVRSMNMDEWDEDPADDETDYDFDLAPWLSEEKLLWIAPHDEALTLRHGLPCPYVDLQGRRLIQRLQNGHLWTRADV